MRHAEGSRIVGLIACGMGQEVCPHWPAIRLSTRPKGRGFAHACRRSCRRLQGLWEDLGNFQHICQEKTMNVIGFLM